MHKDQAAGLKNFSQQSGVFNQHKTGAHIHKHLRTARLTAADLEGPVIERTARFAFNLVTCRQDELFYLARLDARAAARADASRGEDGQMDRSGWTAVERDVLDSLRWWPLDELDAAVGAGMIVYPGSLPALARALLRGWDGTLLTIREED